MNEEWMKNKNPIEYSEFFNMPNHSFNPKEKRTAASFACTATSRMDLFQGLFQFGYEIADTLFSIS